MTGTATGTPRKPLTRPRIDSSSSAMSQARARPNPPAIAHPWTRGRRWACVRPHLLEQLRQPAPGQVVVEVLVGRATGILRHHAREVGPGAERLVAGRRGPPPGRTGPPWPGPAPDGSPAMTSQVMALRRSGRLMVSVRTGPLRTASRSSEPGGVGLEAPGSADADWSDTPRRYPDPAGPVALGRVARSAGSATDYPWPP